MRYRALRPDAEAPFVCVGGEGHETVHEDGAPEGGGGVVAIEYYDVPAEEDARFLALWEEERAGLAGRQGYLGTRLYRAVDDADHRFVAITRWSSPLMVQRAGITAPALYLVEPGDDVTRRS